MPMPFRVAVIPSRDRLDDLARLVANLAGVVDVISIVDNGYNPPLAAESLRRSIGYASRATIEIARRDQSPPNLSMLWNAGITKGIGALGFMAAGAPISVAVLNDDTDVGSAWFDLVESGMRQAGAAAACTDASVHAPTLLQRPAGGWPRLCGWAFMIAGEQRDVRPDERLRWWGGDNDVDMRARLAGGTLLIPGGWAPNRYANQTTVGPLLEQAGRDRETFKEIWGFHAW